MYSGRNVARYGVLGNGVSGGRASSTLSSSAATDTGEVDPGMPAAGSSSAGRMPAAPRYTDTRRLPPAESRLAATARCAISCIVRAASARARPLVS